MNKDPRVRLEGVLRSIPVVYVPIENQNAGQLVSVYQVLGG